MNPMPHIKAPNPSHDPKVHIHKMVTKAFYRYDNLHKGCEDQNQFDSQPNMENPIDDVDFLVDHEGHQEALMEEMTLKDSTPLYEGASTSMLLAMLLLLNLKAMHGVSNASMDELFSLLLWKKLLPNVNKMLTTTYEASKIVKAFGLSYDSIHACPNGCILFGGTLAHERMCPECNNNQFVDKSTKHSQEGASTFIIDSMIVAEL